eukprot:CAMPEP_0203816440 /NCGR_PEP_ID=MMETSP0115-20131106/15076_1 /ASSEMBLY_ACC=CAM_ASM_000227 /TAXON_ID=33651 /ORGANISM="Bicosoecid sp, Strain ms1" /LENGTH=113 /DNA_ID=CAMNT_0050725345 /DNA_START=23 /DNA_END=364 /DNA_ORIENTATION=-
MAGAFGKVVVALGVLLFVHSGFSMSQYKALLAVAEDPDAPDIPIDVLIEVVLACAVTLVGVLFAVGRFQPIHVADERERSLDVLDSRPDFALYNHRGRAFAALRKRFGVDAAE